MSSVHSSSGFVAEPETYIPQLITTLTDEDQFVVDQCLLKVDKFSKVDKFLNALFISEPLVNAIINAVNKAAQMLREVSWEKYPFAIRFDRFQRQNWGKKGKNNNKDILNPFIFFQLTASPTPPDEEQMKAAVERAICSTNIMRNISNKSQGREVIVLAGGVPGITSFISCPIDRVMINAITVIHNLLLKNNSEDLRNNIRAAGGTEVGIHLLTTLHNFFI